jgi:hypothetical protein
MKIENIPIDGQSVANAIMYNYPNGLVNLNSIKERKLYDYLILFGIRVSTCDTSMPDDLIGGIRLKKSFFGGLFGGDYWDICVSNGSTDPSPYWLTNPMSDAAQYGGTAWVKEGQYVYRKRYGGFMGYPAFEPMLPINVYRWKPSQQQINDAKAKKVDLSSEFEIAKSMGQVIDSTSNDTLIHRTWSNKLYKDSAGCQVFGDNDALITLSKWAQTSIELRYGNAFFYTLLTKDQFVNANTNLSMLSQAYNLFKVYQTL